MQLVNTVAADLNLPKKSVTSIFISISREGGRDSTRTSLTNFSQQDFNGVMTQS